jgi:hypothetical protein
MSKIKSEVMNKIGSKVMSKIESKTKSIDKSEVKFEVVSEVRSDNVCIVSANTLKAQRAVELFYLHFGNNLSQLNQASSTCITQQSPSTQLQPQGGVKTCNLDAAWGLSLATER